MKQTKPAQAKELRSLSLVFGGHEVRGVNSQPLQPPVSRSPSLLAICGVVVGAASLLANIIWNCNTCGWDLDGVPWYEALLVAGVPFAFAPLAIILVGVRALIVRSRSAFVEWGAMSVGLALPWGYFLVMFLLHPL